jgi:hypothetical protein
VGYYEVYEQRNRVRLSLHIYRKAAGFENASEYEEHAESESHGFGTLRFKGIVMFIG